MLTVLSLQLLEVKLYGRFYSFTHLPRMTSYFLLNFENEEIKIIPSGVEAKYEMPPEFGGK